MFLLWIVTKFSKTEKVKNHYFDKSIREVHKIKQVFRKLFYNSTSIPRAAIHFAAGNLLNLQTPKTYVLFRINNCSPFLNDKSSAVLAS